VTISILGLVAAASVGIGQKRAVAARNIPAEHVLDIPSQIGPYKQSGPDEEVADNIRQQLKASSILLRPYRSPQGWPVHLTIVYTGISRRSIHFPEVCLVGQGWEVRDKYSDPVGFSFDARRLVLVNGAQQQAVLYWFKTGEKFTGNFVLNSWYWAANQLTFGSSTSAMIKLTAPLVNGREEQVFTILEDFATKIEPILRDRVK